MVEVGDIVEITDPKWKAKKVSMLGRRYEVKDIPNRRGNFPALKATPLKFKDEKGPTHPLYNPQPDGSSWESHPAGFTHKGRTRTIPKNTYQVIQSSGQSPASPTSPSEPSDSSDDAPTFGMAGKGSASPSDDKPDEVPIPEIKVKKTLTVEQQVAEAAKICLQMSSRSNNHFETYPNDRELEYSKFTRYRIPLDEDNAKGLSVRIVFSSPIDEIDPAATYGDEKGFWKAAELPRQGLVRQYTIGKAVEDVINRSTTISPLQMFKNQKKWNEGGKVKGIVIEFAPSSYSLDGMADSGPDEMADSGPDGTEYLKQVIEEIVGESQAEDPESFKGLGSLFGAEDMDGLSTYPRIIVNLVADDGEEFSLTHTFQKDISFNFPELKEEETVEEQVSAVPLFGGIKATSSMMGQTPTPDEDATSKTLSWEEIIQIPNYDSVSNRFPSTQKGAGDSAYEIRAVLGIDFDHDHSVFRPYEKPYEVPWDKAPSIMATGATGYIEAVFRVSAPNLPDGSVTDRLPGYYGEASPPYNPEWMLWPRKVSIILPSADSAFMRIPVDTGDEWLTFCDEIKFYEHKKKIRDIQLMQTRITEEPNETTYELEEVTTLLTATWKVGEDYEFKTTTYGASKEKYQTFKGELTGLIVKPNDSRDPAFNSAEESRRERRLLATKNTDEADIFFNKDESNTNTFVIVLKNETDTAYSGQIIRVNLGGKTDE
jgi:hypothetical protein